MRLPCFVAMVVVVACVNPTDPCEPVYQGRIINARQSCADTIEIRSFPCVKTAAGRDSVALVVVARHCPE